MFEQFVNSISAPLAPFLDESYLYFFLQLGVAATFLVTAVRAWRVSPSRLRELLTAVVFGLLLEEGDIILFGTYSYNAHWFKIGYVPLAIALSWAMIIASAMNFSDVLGLPSAESLARPASFRTRWTWLVRSSLAPVADALWAILLDLSLDAVAIRVGLWKWNIPLDRGWFGVPWGNFYSWLFVAAMFSFFTRLVRRRTAERGASRGWLQLAVPFLAYAGLLASLAVFTVFQVTVFAANRQNTWPIFLVTLAAFAAVTVSALADFRRRPRAEPDRWLMVVRGAMHLTFLLAIFTTRIYVQLPILLGTALAMLGLEMALTWLVTRAASARHSALGSDVLVGEARAE